MTDTENTAEAATKPSALSQLLNLFVAPSLALDYADRHPKMWWLPLGVTLALQLILGIWVTLTINIQVVHAMMLRALAQSHSEHAAQAAQMISHHGRGFMMIGVIIGIVFFAIGELIFALYLLLTDKVFSADNRGYGHWLSFTAWTWLPFTIATIASGIAWAFVSHSAGIPSDVTSLNALLFHFKPTDRHLFSIAQFSIVEFGIIALVAYGLKRWCNFSTAKATVVALIPYAVFYAIKYFI